MLKPIDAHLINSSISKLWNKNIRVAIGEKKLKLKKT